MFLRNVLGQGIKTNLRKQSIVRSFSVSTLIKQEKNHDLLEKYYSSDLLESIKIAEKVIEPEHWAKRTPSTKFSPPYLDNFKELDPYWDHLNTPQIDFTKPAHNLSSADIPKGAILAEGSGNSNRAIVAEEKLAKLTGFSPEYLASLDSKILIRKTVRNKTKKGNINSFYCLAIAGDKNGMVGVGEGKDRLYPAQAANKAIWNAKKNLKFIPRLENRTILGNIDYRYHAVKLFLRSASPGFGLRVNHYIFEVCEFAGIKDLSAKVYKSRNGMNIIKGLVEALSSAKTLEEMAEGRGKKIIDLRKAYYSPS